MRYLILVVMTATLVLMHSYSKGQNAKACAQDFAVSKIIPGYDIKVGEVSNVAYYGDVMAVEFMYLEILGELANLKAGTHYCRV